MTRASSADIPPHFAAPPSPRIELGKPDQDVHDGRIELDAGELQEFRPRGFLAERLPVRTVGTHDVPGVSGRYDPRAQRDGLALQPGGITRAVKKLVVMKDRGQRRGEILE